MNITQYWNEVHRQEATLPADQSVFWLVSVDNPAFGTRSGGAPTSVLRRLAAELLAKGTHRLATDAEVKVHLGQRQASADAIAAEESKRRRFTVQLTPELVAASAAHVGKK